MKTLYNFDQIIDRRKSDSIKWHTYGEDVLPMWVADMDFISPEPVLRALRERVEHGVFGYPVELRNSPGEDFDFRQTIVDRLAELYEWNISKEDIITLPGVVTGFNLACHALANPSQVVLVQTPVYPPILHAAQNTGILHQEMELTLYPDGSYGVDWDVFEASITPKTRLFILCNPHNPIGKVFNINELRRIADLCLRNGVVICSDEIHCDLLYKGYRHVPIASLDPQIAQNTITLMSPSKTFNLAGLQCSIAIISNRELRKRYLKARKGLVPWVNAMGLTAAQAAYKEGQEWLEQVLHYLESNRDFLYNFVQDRMPGIHMGKPEGTYLAWLDCRQSGIEGNPYQFFLEKCRVAFNDGETFGCGGSGFVRLNFGCPRSILIEALTRMQTALDSR